MTLEQLRIFVAVAERQHLTQAADVLALTPSAVSASIRALEERYGTPLFDRVGRRIETNAAGRLFLVEARATLASAAAAERALAELADGERGTLRVQASQTIASYWLPPLLVAFRARHPRIDIELEAGNSHSVARAVLEGEAELGLVEGLVEAPDLHINQAGSDRIVVAVTPQHPWAQKKRLSAAELQKGEWVMREQGSGTRSALEAMLAEHGVQTPQLQVALTLPSNEAMRSAVLANGGYAAGVSELVVAPYLDAGLLVRAPVKLPPRGFYLLRHRARYRSKAARALEEVLASAQP
ncbi:LysR family transcriptional regulator [Pseudoduganella sp. RAF53_2]|uniref:LysR family transcriptional regulator n=1 Tax=unclassified Pseudoduganella TaxID=2637179 RepID=UPI003F9E414C